MVAAGQRPSLRRLERRVAHRLECHQPVERAQQLAHVVDRERSHRLEHPSAERGPPLFGFAAEDRHPGFIVGRRYVDDQPPGEPPDQPLVQRFDLGRRPVAGEHDLPVGRLQRIGEPQELRLHLAAVGEELDVVHQQQIDIVEPPPVRIALARRDGGVEGLHELVQCEILDRQRRVDAPARRGRCP